MVLDEVLRKEVNGYSQQDWEPLFALIPEIENTSDFGEWVGMKMIKKGVFHIPYYIPSPIVEKFMKILHTVPVLIDFDWPAWDEGRNMGSDDSFNFDSTDLLTKCKLITAIVRSDRFCEGALVLGFQSGLILRILKSMAKEVSGER